jgi:hypothetical protein
MERKGNESNCMMFLHVRAITITETYKAAYELWRKRNSYLRTNIEANLLLNKTNLNNKILETLKLMR